MSFAPSRLPYQPDYTTHPAFAPHMAWNAADDPAVDGPIDELNALVALLEGELSLKRVDLAGAMGRLVEPVRRLCDRISELNRARGADFGLYAWPFQLELVRMLVDDLAYFARRGSHTPVLANEYELALRNRIAIDGFVTFSLTPDELHSLRAVMQPYVATLETRYRSGGRTREALSMEAQDRESVALVCDLFERRGLNKAVSDVRHEKASAIGYGIELSADDCDWWHSRYEDVGLFTPASSAYFHNDEARDAYKAIIYLDDVNHDNGPFCFLPPSYKAQRPRFEWVASRATWTTLQAESVKREMTDQHPTRGPFTSRVARRFFGMLPTRLRVQSHFGFDVMDDSAVAAQIATDEVKVIAPAGHVIVFDGGRLVHRGGLVRKGRRIAMQVVFEVDKKAGLEFGKRLRQDLEEGHHVR